jgi:predicted O-methyltransferase YrrM
MRTLAASRKPKSYLEIGVCEGESLACVLQHSKLELLVLCDKWGVDYGGSGRGNHAHILRLLKELGHQGETIWLDGDSARLVPSLSVQVEMILVDGDHSASGGLRDLKNAWPLLKPGGVLIFDDLKHPAHIPLQDAYREFLGWSKANDIPHFFDQFGVGVSEKPLAK